MHPSTEDGYYVDTTVTKVVIRYWKPLEPKIIHQCVVAKFYEYSTHFPDGQLSPGSAFTQDHP